MTDTLTDRIDAHLAKAKAAQAEDVGLAIDELYIDISADWNPANTTFYLANDPATIEAFCAVAKAGVCPVCHMRDASGYYRDEHNLGHVCEHPYHDALTALYDALGKE